MARATGREIFVLRDDLIKILDILSPVTKNLIPDDESILKNVNTHLFYYGKVETNAAKKLRHEKDANVKKLHKYFLRAFFSSIKISPPADRNTILVLNMLKVAPERLIRYVNALNCFSYVLDGAKDNDKVKIVSRRKGQLYINYTHFEELREHMNTYPIIPVRSVATKKPLLTDLKNPMVRTSTLAESYNNSHSTSVRSEKSKKKRWRAIEDMMQIDPDNDSDNDSAQEKSQAVNNQSNLDLQNKLEIDCGILFDELDDLESTDSLFNYKNSM